MHGAKRAGPCCEMASADGRPAMHLSYGRDTDIAIIAHVYYETGIELLRNRHSYHCGCDGGTAVARMWHIQDSQGRTLALACKQKSFKYLKANPLCSEAVRGCSRSALTDPPTPTNQGHCPSHFPPAALQIRREWLKSPPKIQDGFLIRSTSGGYGAPLPSEKGTTEKNFKTFA